MTTITLEPKLYERIEKVARNINSITDEIISEATERYLWDLNRRQITAESRRFQQQHERVWQNYPHRAVMITLVNETPETVLVRRGFRYENAAFTRRPNI
ncbi:MAG: hypothetical protein GY796_06130 [Chloroflexi bacterium]|nr:hypothetical protein [Chloroflexota bacterium]